MQWVTPGGKNRRADIWSYCSQSLVTKNIYNYSKAMITTRSCLLFLDIQTTQVGPLITDPPPSRFTTLFEKKKENTQHTWLVTSNTWHVICYTWWELKILSKCQLSSFIGFGFMIEAIFSDIRGLWPLTRLFPLFGKIHNPFIHEKHLRNNNRGKPGKSNESV